MIDVELIRAWPRRFESLRLQVPEGTTVGAAIAAGGWDIQAGGFVGCAIHGQRVDGATVLQAGDRIELLRPLVADPKDARRRRAGGTAGR